jgi:hypothetical protein
MSKKRCKKKDYSPPDNPKYCCEKCGRLAKEEDQVCEPEKLKKKE